MQYHLPRLLLLFLVAFSLASCALLLLIAPVALKEGKRDLHQYLPDKVLIDGLPLLFALRYELSQVAATAVLHHDVQSCLLLVDYLIEASNDVLVLQLTKDVHFVDELVYFFLSQLPIVYLFPHHLFASWQVLYERYGSKCSFANIVFQQLVFVHDCSILNLNFNY